MVATERLGIGSLKGKGVIVYAAAVNILFHVFDGGAARDDLG